MNTRVANTERKSAASPKASGRTGTRKEVVPRDVLPKGTLGGHGMALPSKRFADHPLYGPMRDIAALLFLPVLLMRGARRGNKPNGETMAFALAASGVAWAAVFGVVSLVATPVAVSIALLSPNPALVAPAGQTLPLEGQEAIEPVSAGNALAQARSH